MSANDHIHDGVFHPGEVLLQEKVGLAERMAEVGPKVIRRFMPEQHRAFFEGLAYVIIGGLGHANQPWATVLYGAPGFIRSPNEMLLRIKALPSQGDPLFNKLTPGTPVGILGFEAHTRRRNRANGIVLQADNDGFYVHILESFGNCPKYIQAREATVAEALTTEQSPSTHVQKLDDSMRHLVGNADTFFIASAHPGAEEEDDYGVDVSHRGGNPGFVKLEETSEGLDRLVIPDFVGNFFFNTFGNITLNPKVGLLFIDYSSYDILHIEGDAELILDGPAIDTYQGAERLFTVTVRSAVRRPSSLPLKWGPVEPSPFLEHTGRW